SGRGKGASSRVRRPISRAFSLRRRAGTAVAMRAHMGRRSLLGLGFGFGFAMTCAACSGSPDAPASLPAGGAAGVDAGASPGTGAHGDASTSPPPLVTDAGPSGGDDAT